MSNPGPFKCLIAGHSHLGALKQATVARDATFEGYEFEFLNYWLFRNLSIFGNPFHRAYVIEHFKQRAKNADAIILCIAGSQHGILGMFEHGPFSAVLDQVERLTRDTLNDWLGLLSPLVEKKVAVLGGPPPNVSEQHVREFPGEFAQKIRELPFRIPHERLTLWQAQMRVTEEVAARHGLAVIRFRDDIFAENGCLAPDCYGGDPIHCNETYGQRALGSIMDHFADLRQQTCMETQKPEAHFYVGLPDYAYWRQSISDLPQEAVDPVCVPKFLLTRTDKVAAAGSCFAQHILGRLLDQDFDCLITERPVPNADADEQPARFSAQFGNVYTSRQLLQLFERAFGEFEPSERVWTRPDSRFCDPFRPLIEADGFASGEAVIEASERHLAAVRTMFRELDVFIFTLGLTECWQSRADGAVYPVAPGVAGGTYDPTQHQLLNLAVREVVQDLNRFTIRLKRANPKAKIIYTVSPVPLVATAIDRHVLVSTTWSKSVLRVALGEVCDRHDFVEYFPSYEIITGSHASGAYFGPDRRSVTGQGVDHVMKVFLSRMTDVAASPSVAAPTRPQGHVAEMQAMADAACEEEMLAKG